MQAWANRRTSKKRHPAQQLCLHSKRSVTHSERVNSTVQHYTYYSEKLNCLLKKRLFMVPIKTLAVLVKGTFAVSRLWLSKILLLSQATLLQCLKVQESPDNAAPLGYSSLKSSFSHVSPRIKTKIRRIQAKLRKILTVAKSIYHHYSYSFPKLVIVSPAPANIPAYFGWVIGLYSLVTNSRTTLIQCNG